MGHGWWKGRGRACSLCACGHLEFKQKSHSKLKCMQRARLLQHWGLGSLCGLLMFPGCIPRPQVPPPETLLRLALFPEKMQGRLEKAAALSPCLLLTPQQGYSPSSRYRRLGLKCRSPGLPSRHSHSESLRRGSGNCIFIVIYKSL